MLRSVFEFVVVFVDGRLCFEAEEGEQRSDQAGFLFGVDSAPGFALDFDEFAELGLNHGIDVDEELDALELNVEAQAVFLDFEHRVGSEILAVEAQRIAGLGDVAAA